MGKNQQLAMWVNGNPVHDEENNLHVPDYSCCYPRLAAPKKVKKLYLRALKERDGEQIEFFERIFKQEFDKEEKKFSEAVKEVSGYKNGMVADVVKAVKEMKKK